VEKENARSMNMKHNPKALRRTTRRSAVLRFTFVLVICFGFLGLLEVLFRTTHLFGAKISWSEPDPILGYRFTPGSFYWFNKENDHPITGRINSYGYRDKEWSIDKPENTYRIAVLGDSVVAAFPVESQKTFLALTENKLSKINQGFKVELMNFGRPSMTQTEELLILEADVVKFSPDMVVLFFLAANDIKDVRRETASPELMRPFYHVSENGELLLDTSFAETSEFKVRRFVNAFKQRSALISLVVERVTSYRYARRMRSKGPSNSEKKGRLLERHLTLSTVNPHPAYARSYLLNKALIKAMARFCEERGIAFLLVTIETAAYMPEVEEAYRAIEPTFDANFFEDDLRDYSNFLGTEYLGLQRTFRGYYQNTGTPLHWGHWNYQGHQVVADALTEKLKSILYTRQE
jgi:lysophospholipase L1-like esterase